VCEFLCVRVFGCVRVLKRTQRAYVANYVCLEPHYILVFQTNFHVSPNFVCLLTL